MNEDETRRVLAHPVFQALVRRRNRFALTLVAIMVISYFGFILLVAFESGWLGRPLGAGPITIGLWLALGVMVVAFVVTGLYVRRARREFDELTRRLIEDLK